MESKFTLRELDENDYNLNYLDVLSQLTTVGTVTHAMFIEFIKNKSANHHIYVIHDKESNKIIGTGTLLIEDKIIHSCGKVGHVEDIVVDNKFRGSGLGKQIIDLLKQIAINKKCYKIILDCSAENVSFYGKCGFVTKEIQMVIYL